MRQVFVKAVPGANCVPSGIVTSLTKVALSQPLGFPPVLPPVPSLEITVNVLVALGLGVGVPVAVAVNVGVLVSVAGGVSEKDAFTVSATYVST